MIYELQQYKASSLVLAHQKRTR